MSEQKGSFLGTEKLSSLLFKLSLPAIVAMVVNSLYNVVDRIFVGQGVGALAIGALSITFPIQLFIGAVGIGMGAGCASLVSRSLGANDTDTARKTIGTGISVLTILSALMMAILLIFPNQVLIFLGATEELLPYSREYLDIIVWGVPFICLGMLGNNVLRSEGRAKAAMASLLIGAVGNIILDPIFIFTFDMGIRGAALATLLSRILSGVWVMIVLQKGSKPLKLHEYAINLGILKETSLIGLASFIQQAGMSIVTIVVNNLLRAFGTNTDIIIYGISQTFLMFLVMPAIGIAQGFQPVAGFNYGAQKYHRLREVCKLGLKWMFTITLAFWLFAIIFPSVFIKMFVSEASVVTQGTPVLRTMVAAFILVPLNILGSVYFQAIGKQGEAFFLSLSRQFIILIPVLFLLGYAIGIEGIWLAFPIADLLSSILTGTLFYKNIKNLPYEDSCE